MIVAGGVANVRIPRTHAITAERQLSTHCGH